MKIEWRVTMKGGDGNFSHKENNEMKYQEFSAALKKCNLRVTAIKTSLVKRLKHLSSVDALGRLSGEPEDTIVPDKML